MPTPINTEPSSPPPKEASIEAAMKDVPEILMDMENEIRAYKPAPGERIVYYHRLIKELREKKHIRAAAEYAIHRLVQQGKLTANRRGAPFPNLIFPLKYGYIESTAALWEWWKALDPSKGDEPGAVTRTQAPRPLLKPAQEAVLDLLKALSPGRGLTGPKIIDALSKRKPKIVLSQSILTSRIMPPLTKHYMVRNDRNGLGYYVTPE